MKTTITEALAEIKLIGKKLEAKKIFVQGNLTRFKHVPDILGDSKLRVASEMQAISDLQNRLVLIRRKIAEANLKETLSVKNTTKTVFEWITWKREIAPTYVTFLNANLDKVKRQSDDLGVRPQVFKDKDEKTQLAELVIHIDYSNETDKLVEVKEILELLDGQLSLKNAVTFIEI